MIHPWLSRGGCNERFDIIIKISAKFCKALIFSSSSCSVGDEGVGLLAHILNCVY